MSKKKPPADKNASGTKKPKGKAGRPSGYDPKYVDIARRACEMGSTDVEVAALLGVHRVTLYRWCTQHPELAEAMTVGKESADRRVFLASYRLAIGWEEEEEVVQYDTKRGKFVRTTVTKHVPPDRHTNYSWMKNRLGWRDKIDHEHTGKDGGPIRFASNIERARRLLYLLKQVRNEAEGVAADGDDLTT